MNKNGFTLIELLIVVAIVGILNDISNDKNAANISLTYPSTSLF